MTDHYPKTEGFPALETLGNFHFPNMYEAIAYQFFDRIITSKDENILFRIPVGVDGKTFADTNMLRSGKFPKDCIFVLYYISGYTERETTFRLTIADKIYAEFNAENLFSFPIRQAPLVLKESWPIAIHLCDVEPGYRVAVRLDGGLYRPVL